MVWLQRPHGACVLEKTNWVCLVEQEVGSQCKTLMFYGCLRHGLIVDFHSTRLSLLRCVAACGATVTTCILSQPEMN
jgi:hypothetical protein